jgi:hypothetical protein
MVNTSRNTKKASIAAALLAIFLLAFGLRVWGISFGLPYDFTPDELHEIVRALKLGAGEYSWVSGKGGLYLILFVEYAFLFAYWWLTGQVQGATDFALKYLQDPTDFYLLGRVTVAVMGAATCVVIFAVGRRIYGWQVGLTASLIGATTYYHAMWSHYINVDTGMTLAIWLSVLAYLIYEETRAWRWLVASGLLAGVAVAFKIPGGIGLPILLLAIATSSSFSAGKYRKIREAGVLLVAMTLAVAVISPENILAIPGYTNAFSRLFVSEAAAASPETYEWADIYEITVLHGSGYLTILLREYNIALTVAAVVGMLIGVIGRIRWDFIWIAAIGSFLIVMTMADRPGMERYLMPLTPAFWLLAARAVVHFNSYNPAILPIGLIAIIGPSMFALIEQNYTWTKPDTRVLAKAWIENHVPSDAKILMDGMQYRFIQSPPLTPNGVAVARRIEGVLDKDGRVSRGVSGNTLELYANAMAGLKGPKYDLHSTVYGLGVEELEYYAESCFDYIVTSSDISRRFQRAGYEDRYPLSARFYREIRTDPQFELVYSIQPVRWRVQGPEIDVYRVLSSCS